MGVKHSMFPVCVCGEHKKGSCSYDTSLHLAPGLSVRMNEIQNELFMLSVLWFSICNVYMCVRASEGHLADYGGVGGDREESALHSKVHPSHFHSCRKSHQNFFPSEVLSPRQ